MTTTTKYGYCPECGGRGVSRERRPNGNDTCENGHAYPSSNGLLDPVKPPAMTTPTTAEQPIPICVCEIFWQGDDAPQHHPGCPVLREIVDTRATIARLEGELGESNRLLGEALLRADRLQSDANARAGWLREAKQQRGFDDNVSFDVVWKDVCTRADAAERRVEALNNVIAWALGERDGFPDRPEGVKGKPYPFYWWRSELRRRALAAASGDMATTEG